MVDGDATESPVKPDQVGVYAITKKYTARPVTLSNGPSLVLKTFSKDVIDDHNGDVVAVKI